MSSPGSLVISGLGMMSNLGHDVVTACAAQRAGLVRRYPLGDYSAFDEATLEAPVTGAPIKGFTDGFIQSGTWVRLALAALEDLVRYGGLPGPGDHRFWGTTGLMWVLPELSFERFLWPETEVPSLLKRFCGDLLAELSQLPLRMVPNGFITTGPVGVVTAVRQLEELFARSSLERVIILGSDSWVDRLSMGLLIREGRLKTTEQAVGLCPGEAAACLLVEKAAQAQRRGARTEARILSAALRPGQEVLDDEAPPSPRSQQAPGWARHLASAVIEALEAAGAREPFRGDIILDLNGEQWKALLWGHAQVLLHEHIDFNKARMVVPCVSFGDIGAASGVAALGIATRSFVRGGSSTNRTLICSISDDGGTGALLAESHPAPPLKPRS